MKTRKTFRLFTIFGYEKEQVYLREMHRSGWKFIKVSIPGIYHFEKCDPEDVVYQLDYNQEGLAHKEEYVQMFRDCGWEYLQDCGGYSYFRKSASEANGAEEIFCDDHSRAQMLERVFKGRLLPMVIIFSMILIPQFLLNLIVKEDYLLAAIFGVLFVLYAAVFARFASQYLKFKKKRE